MTDFIDPDAEQASPFIDPDSPEAEAEVAAESQLQANEARQLAEIVDQDAQRAGSAKRAFQSAADAATGFVREIERVPLGLLGAIAPEGSNLSRAVKRKRILNDIEFELRKRRNPEAVERGKLVGRLGLAAPVALAGGLGAAAVGKAVLRNKKATFQGILGVAILSALRDLKN